MTDTATESLRQRFESVFGAIAETRMAGLPVMNPALSVAARGFEPCGEHRVGVLTTPWFMDLILIPSDAPPRRVGEKATFTLPSGTYECVWGYEDGVGGYWCCSLFSPMFQFADWDTALTATDAALAELLKPEETEAPPKSPTYSRRDLFRRRADAGERA